MNKYLTKRLEKHLEDDGQRPSVINVNFARVPSHLSTEFLTRRVKEHLKNDNQDPSIMNANFPYNPNNIPDEEMLRYQGILNYNFGK